MSKRVPAANALGYRERIDRARTSERSVFVAQRILLGSLVLLATLLSAELLGADRFARFAIFLMLVKLLPSLQFGAVTGYLVAFYDPDPRWQKPLKAFTQGYSAHLLSLAALCAVVGVAGVPHLVWAAVCFAGQVPFLAIEPSARTSRRFTVALMPDLVLSVCAIVMVVCVRVRVLPVRHLEAAVALAVVVIGVVALRRMPKGATSFWRESSANVALANYLSVLRAGFVPYLATLCAVVLLSIDRLFAVSRLGEAGAGLFLLGFQIATGAGLVLSSSNFVAAIDVGEAGRSARTAVLASLRTGIRIALFLWCAAVAGSVVLERFILTGFEGLASVVAVLTAGLLVFHVAGSVTPKLMYVGKQGALVGALLVLIFLSLGVNLGLAAGPYDEAVHLAIQAAAFFSVYGAFAIVQSLR